MYVCFRCTLVSIVPIGHVGMYTSIKAILPLHSSSVVNFIYVNNWLTYQKKVLTSVRFACKSIVQLTCSEYWLALWHHLCF